MICFHISKKFYFLLASLCCFMLFLISLTIKVAESKHLNNTCQCFIYLENVVKSLHLTVVVWLQIIKVLGRSDTNASDLCQLCNFLLWFIFPIPPLGFPLCFWPVFLSASKGRCKAGAWTWTNKAHSQQSAILSQSLQQQFGCWRSDESSDEQQKILRTVQILGSFKVSLCCPQIVQEFQQHTKFWNLWPIVTYSCQDTVPGTTERTQEIKDKKTICGLLTI